MFSQFVLRSGLGDIPSVHQQWAGIAGPDSALIGTFAVTPTGIPLASVNTFPLPSNDDGIYVDMLRRALERWEELKRNERLYVAPLPQIPNLESWRWATVIPRKQVPPETVTLRAYTRDLPRQGGWNAGGYYQRDWSEGNWNMDYVWLEDARSLVPADPKAGAVYPLPSWIAKRLAQYHLVDNVLGKGEPFQPSHVEKADLQFRVTGVSESRIELRLTGQTRAVARGVWSECEVCLPTEAERGFETDIYGWVEFNPVTQTFERFDAVAIGTRWGSTASSRRYDTEFDPPTDDRAPSPIGVAFQLFEGGINDSVPPDQVWTRGARYFDRL